MTARAASVVCMCRMPSLNQWKRETAGPHDPVTQSTVCTGARAVGFAPSPLSERLPGESLRQY
jgi:hypothetical protein